MCSQDLQPLPNKVLYIEQIKQSEEMLLKKTSTSLMSTKLMVFRALFTRVRVDSPVSKIIYVPQVRPPRLPWCKCCEMLVGQHMTPHNKKKATVRPLPK